MARYGLVVHRVAASRELQLSLLQDLSGGCDDEVIRDISHVDGSTANHLFPPRSAIRTFAASSSVASMSIAMTLRAILDSGNVNQPSPEHRSTTSMPGVTPTSLSTLAGSGH